MGKLYQIGSPPPPRKPSGNNPVMWALIGGSVVMVFMAIILALVLKLRTPTPVREVRAASVPAAQPEAAGFPAEALSPQSQTFTPSYPFAQPRPPRARRMRPTSYPRPDWPPPATPPAMPITPMNGAGATALPPSQYLPQQSGTGYAPPSVRTVQGPGVPAVSGNYGSPAYPRYQQAAAYGSGSPQDVIARVKGSVLLILADGPSGLGSGTGFVISGNQVATCAHVIEGARSIQLFAPDGRRYRAAVGNADRLNDVAVLTVSGSLPPALSLGSYHQARDGDEVAVTGYPQVFSMLAEGYAPTPSTTRGAISAKRTQNVNGMVVPQIQTDAAVNPGNSGGPLYSLRDGTVYGLAASLLGGSQGMNFASSVDALRRLASR